MKMPIGERYIINEVLAIDRTGSQEGPDEFYNKVGTCINHCWRRGASHCYCWNFDSNRGFEEFIECAVCDKMVNINELKEPFLTCKKCWYGEEEK